MKAVLRVAVMTLAAAAAVAIIGLPPRLSAAQGDSFDLEGTISRLSPGKLTVDSGQGILFHVIYNDKTVIVRADGKPGTPRDFKVGLRIHASGDFNEAGEVAARRIEIQPPPASSNPQSPPPS